LGFFEQGSRGNDFFLAEKWGGEEARKILFSSLVENRKSSLRRGRRGLNLCGGGWGGLLGLSLEYTLLEKEGRSRKDLLSLFIEKSHWNGEGGRVQYA